MREDVAFALKSASRIGCFILLNAVAFLTLGIGALIAEYTALAMIFSFLITIILGVFPLWIWYQIVKKYITTEDGAFRSGTKWWLVSHTLLCAGLAYLNFTSHIWLIKIDHVTTIWVQYAVAATIALPVGFIAFYIKKTSYRNLNKG